MNNTEIQKEIINLSMQRYSPSEGWRKHEIFIPTEIEKLPDSTYQNILRLKYEFIKNIRQTLNHELKKPNISDDDAEHHIKSIMRHNTTIIEISKILGVVVSR